MASKKKQNENLIVGFCLDESGSMSQIEQATISGFNEYLSDLRSQPGSTLLSLTMFSDRHGPGSSSFREFCVATDVGRVKDLDRRTYTPHGNTPLYDAIGHTVRELEAQIGDTSDPVLFVIQTDGLENASREWTRERIVDLIQEKEAAGWKFIYLGANQDEMTAERAGAIMGMSVGSTVAYDYGQTRIAYSGVTAASSGLRTNSARTSAETATTVRDTIAAAENKKGKAKPRSTPNF